MGFLYVSFSLCSPPRGLPGANQFFTNQPTISFPVQCIFYSTNPPIFIAPQLGFSVCHQTRWVVVFWNEWAGTSTVFLGKSFFFGFTESLVGLPVRGRGGNGSGWRKTFNLIWGTLLLLPCRAHSVRDSLEGFVIIEFWESVILLQSLPGFSARQIWTFQPASHQCHSPLADDDDDATIRWDTSGNEIAAPPCGSDHKLESLTLILL